MVKFFGWSFNKDVPPVAKNADVLPEPPNPDGSLEMENSYYGSFYSIGANLDPDVNLQDEVRLITRYREISRQPEFVRAIDDIINEAFSYDTNTFPVKVNLDDVEEINEGVKKKIYKEFDNILYMLNFKNESYEVFRRWYVDGRLYYQKVVNKNKPTDGIKELRYIDPRKIRRIRQKKMLGATQTSPGSVQPTPHVNSIPVNVTYDEYFLYNPRGVSPSRPEGIKIELDAITYVNSGVYSKDNRTVLSHLHQAIRFYNMLRQLEDAVVIYRLTRAPERRVFNVEVGQLPPKTAEQYLQSLIQKFRKKLSFDPTTGETIEQKRYMAMQEDFWFARRDGKGTTVETLNGGQNLGQMEDVDYFRRKLYEALNVPFSRLDPTSTFNLGRSSEITRDELKFSKFVNRLRKRFSTMFDDLLKTQLILKKIVDQKTWDEIAKNIYYDYIEDNHFTELKNGDILTQRLALLSQLDPYVGKYFSKEYARKEVLQMDDDQIAQMREQMDKEAIEEPDPEMIQPEGAMQDDPTSAPPPPKGPPGPPQMSKPGAPPGKSKPGQ